MWLPDGWWHETCTSGYSIAVGALTTLEAMGPRDPRPCAPPEYTTSDLPYCKEHACPGLDGS
jgi:hypothetical protein